MKIYVQNENDRIIAAVEYNNLLDNENSVYHRGITKLRSGEYVLMDSDELSYYKAYTVDDYVAFEAILTSGHEELLQTDKFKPLYRFYDELTTEI